MDSFNKNHQVLVALIASYVEFHLNLSFYLSQNKKIHNKNGGQIYSPQQKRNEFKTLINMIIKCIFKRKNK